MTHYHELGIDTGLSVWQDRLVFHIGDVVRKLRLQKGLDQSDIVERAQMSPTTVSELERGQGNQRRDTLERVARALDTTVEEMYALLATAQRGPSLQDEAERVDVDVADYKRDDIPIIQEGEASPMGLIWDADGRSVREIEEFTSRPAQYRERGAYAVVLRGDSMEPTLKRGMRLIISPNIPVGDGDLAYVQMRTGERLIKIATKTTDGWLLTSANPAYSPRGVRNDEIEHLHRVAYVRLLK